MQYNVRHLLLYSIFSSSKSYRNLDICHFILYFLTRNHIEIEMARKYTDHGHHKESSVPVKKSSQNKGKKATKDSHQCKERSSGESHHKEHQHSQESTAKGTGEGGLKEKKDRPKVELLILLSSIGQDPFFCSGSG